MKQRMLLLVLEHLADRLLVFFFSKISGERIKFSVGIFFRWYWFDGFFFLRIFLSNFKSNNSS